MNKMNVQFLIKASYDWTPEPNVLSQATPIYSVWVQTNFAFSIDGLPPALQRMWFSDKLRLDALDLDRWFPQVRPVLEVYGLAGRWHATVYASSDGSVPDDVEPVLRVPLTGPQACHDATYVHTWQNLLDFVETWGEPAN